MQIWSSSSNAIYETKLAKSIVDYEGERGVRASWLGGFWLMLICCEKKNTAE
jgi:hypothetical protein